MAHTLDELRKYRNGRGTSSASSSDSQGRHTLEELRSLDTRRRPQTTQSTQTATTPSEPIKSDRPEGVSSSWMSHTGNTTLDSINNMLSMRKVMQTANATPKNMPTLQTNEEVKDYYESLGNHNAIERLFNKEKAEEYNQKQALYPQYHEIKKEEDMKKLAEYGITDDDMRKYASYLDESSRNNFFRGDTRRQVETRRTDQEIQNIKKATGVDLYDYLDEYKGELAKEDANAHPVLSTLNTYAQNPGESLTNVATDVGAYATGKPIKDNYSYTDTVRNEITENIDSGVGRFAYGTVNSIADMGVAMALGTVTGGGTFVSAGTMGLEKASNVMNGAVDRGLTPNQIMLEGIASGVTTAATEAIPMGKWEEVAKKGFVGLHGKALAKEITKKFLANALPEGLQEMEEDIADAIMDELIAGDKSEINVTISKLTENGYSREQAEAMAWRDWTKQMVLDGLGGFISGGVMSGGSVAVGLANPYARGEVNREALSEQIKGMDTEGETYKAYRELSEKRGENLENATENEVSDLFLKAYEEASTFDRTEVNEIFKEELKKHDYSEEQANETLEAVLAENKTNYQKSLINNSLVKDALKTAYESEEGLNMRLKTRMNQTALEDTIKTSDQVKTEKKIAKAESKINTAEESSVNGEKVEILGMDIKGGVYVINTDKGTFNADDVNVASSIKDAVAYSVNIKDPAFKEAFVTNYRGQDIDTYEAYAYEAFTAGKNFNASILEQGNFIDFLGANALEDFLDAGRMSVSRSTKESEERSIKAAAEAEGKFQKGTFTSEVDYNSLKSTQKKVYNFLKGMANIGGLNINVIYNTETVENGFFQYDSESGGTITVNLAAKARVDEKGIGSTYVIPVLSHELTHYLEKNAESSYMILQKAVFKVLRADGMNIDDEVRSKIEKYKAHNIELTEAEAVHEIIAQACEGMMSNENTMKKTLSYMNEREMKTFKKALDKFFNAVKQFVKSLAGGDEIQNKYADAISRNIDEVQDAWAKAFADALQRQQTLNKEVGLNEEMTADNNTTVVGEDYAQFNIQTYDKSLPFLKDWLKKSGLSAKEQSNILSELESKKDMLESIRKEFPHFDEWSLRDSQEEAIASFGDMSEEEEARMRESVSKYLTAIVNNSEYPYNFDLTTVCKKRQTLNKVLNMLVTDGMFDDFIPDEKTITDLVDTIKANGFEVACALCFVDSKRYRIGSWADSIINGVDAYNQKKKVWVHSYGWNEIVKSMEVKGKVSVNDFNFLNRDIDNEKPNRLASNMTVDELREAGALKLIDKILETESGNTRNRKFANAILRNPSIAHTANVAELLSSEGLDIARIKAPDFHQVVNGASGQATPKLSHDAITYQNDILRKLVEKNVTPEDLYKVGGFRVQSFSDYVANEIFDYIQMVSELAANKFPSHAYTKEYFFVKLFGMTGMKINMSIVPKALADDVNKKFKGWSESRKKKNTEYQYYKAHAGLEKGTNEDGSFDWEDEDGTKWHYIIEDESFGAIRNREKNTYDAKKGFERALEIQSDPRYNKNCGIIWVGVSDAHIRAMMRDKRIPMVIPYHKSSINHLVAEMRAIDAYNDYTDYQIEKYADGTSIEKSDYSKVMGDWDWYADLRKTKDPVQTSKNYIKYCLEHKVRPTFYQFAFEEGHMGDYDYFEEGYYKLLTDFRLYGGNTDGTMDNTFAEQGAVTMTFPEEFESLAKESLAEYESDTTYLDENQKKLYDQAKKIIKQNKKEQKQMSLQEDSEGNKLSEKQQTYFKDSKARDKQGRLLKLYHGSKGGNFDVFKANEFVTERNGVTRIKGYFGTNPEYSEAYGDVSSYYLNVKNPLDFREFNGKGTLESYKRFLSNKGVKDVKFDSGITQSTILGGKFTDKNGKEYTSYIPYELFDNFEYWNGDGNLTEAILNAGYDSIIWDEGYNNTDISVMPFNENAIKRTDNLNPTSDNRIQYSLQEDSEGNKLTEDQVKFFAKSKARDENGNLMAMYHGSRSAGFTVFNSEYSDDMRSLFFTDKLETAKSYSATESLFEPDKPMSYEELSDVVENYFRGEWHLEKDGNDYVLKEEGYIGEEPHEIFRGTLKEAQTHFMDSIEDIVNENSANYKVYLNLENPYIFDAEGNNWDELPVGDGYDESYSEVDIVVHDNGTYEVEYVENGEHKHQIFENKESLEKKFGKLYEPIESEIYIDNIYLDFEGNRIPTNTRMLSQFAQENGYDGVIIKDVIDNGVYTAKRFTFSTVMIAFNANQVKSVYNEHPTEDPDIRYSIQEDSEGNKLSKGQQTYFKKSKAVDSKGRLLKMYHGSESKGFDVFKGNSFVTEINGITKVKGYFCTNPEYSEAYGDVSSYYLNIINPLDMREYDGDGSIESYKAFFDSKGVKNIKFDSGPQRDSLVGGIFKNAKGKEYKSYIPYELFDQIGHYWYGDGNLTEAISKAGYDSVIWYEGYNDKDITILPFEENAIKRTDNLNPTKDERIQYSLQDESEIPDDEKETYQTLEDDVKLLRDFTKLAKEEMKWQAKDMDALSEYLIKKYDSTISAKDLKEELANLFNAIPEQTDNWLNVMDACFGLASEIYEVSNKKVSVDKNVDADARQAVQAAKRRNAIQQIAIDIYNKYWTMTSYYTDNERAKGLKAQHRQNIKNAVEKQKLADTIYYKALIEKTKRRAEEDRARIKTKTEDKIKAMKESNERKAEIQKIEDQAATFAKWIRQNSKNHPVPDILREPLEMLLTTIDPITREKGTANKKQESLSLSIQKVANALSNINNEMAKTDKPNSENTESGLEMLDIPPYMVAELNEIATKMHELEVNYEVPGSKPLQLMELADLKKLKQDMNAIQKAISTANDLITRANKERVNYVGQKIISYLSKLPQAKRDALNETLTKGVDFLTLDNTTPFYFFKHLGEGGSILFDILADGMDDMTDKVEEISDFTKEIYTEEDQKNWRNNIREFELLQKLTDTERASGKENKVKVKLTDAQIMSLYCLSKREVEGRHQALEHILRDGIAIGKIDAKKKIARQDTVTITESQLNDIISIVENDKKMKAVADALQHFMSSVCSDWGNRVTMSRWGIKQFTEKFYFPIAVNAELKKTDAADSVGSLFALLNQDFTKPLQDNVRNEIMVYDIFDVFTKHTSDMARYSALGLPILDLIKVWNYSEAEEKTSGNKDEDEEYKQRKVSSVKKSIAKAFGERGGNKYISTLIKNLNGKADRGVYDNIGMSLMRKYKASKVAASTMTALVQPLSIFRAAYVMDNKYLLRGLAHRPQIEKCFKNVGVAKWKRMSIGVDTNIGRGVDRIINHQTRFGDKVMDKSLWLAEKMDELTWGYIYNAVEEEIKDTHKDLKPGTKEFDEAVSNRAREVFYATQIFDSTLTKSAFMRDKGYHATMLSAFMSEPTLSYNMLLDSVTEYYQDAKIYGSSHAFKNKGKVVASAISVYVLSAAVESVIREAFTRIRDYDEDDEEFFDGFVMAVVDRLLDELNILNKLPYTKQLMDGLSAFKSGYRNNNKMDEAFISDIANSYKAIKKAVEREEVTYKTIYTTLNALSDVTGLPFANALREVKAVWNNTIGRITGNYLK